MKGIKITSDDKTRYSPKRKPRIGQRVLVGFINSLDRLDHAFAKYLGKEYGGFHFTEKMYDAELQRKYESGVVYWQHLPTGDKK
jgi:hypothetical protein